LSVPAILTALIAIRGSAGSEQEAAAARSHPASDGAKESVPASRAPIKPEHLESVIRYNATDDDAQLILFAKDEHTRQALTRVTVRSPDGRRVVVERSAPDPRIGQSVLEFRSSQHGLDQIKRMFPPGEYRWTGRTADGRGVAGTTRVSYSLPVAPRITAPADESAGVPTDGVTIEWSPVPRAESIFVEVENDVDGGREFLVQIEGTATSMSLPDGFLEAGTEYAVELKAVAANGNQAATDATFKTG
jgi:hypothetical protein